MTGTNAPYDEALTEAERYIKWPELQPSSRITLLIAKALVAQRSERGEYLRGLEDAAKKCDEAARTWREGPKSHTDAPAEMAEICARNIRVFKNAPEAPSPNRNAEILRAYAPPSPVAAHTDHPLRHCDRTCPACIAEGQAASGGTPSLKRRMSKIEDEVAQGRMSAAEVFTKMREVVNAAQPSATAAPGGWEPTTWRRVGVNPLKDDTHIEQMTSPFYNGIKFAVRRHGLCLGKKAQWDWEPMPSGRDPAFYEEFRFDSFSEALAALDAAMDGGAKNG